MTKYLQPLLLLLFPILSYAQIPGNGTNCAQAFCLHEQLGVQQSAFFRTTNPPTPAPPTTIGCGDMESQNNLFYAFCATEAQVSIGVELSNCVARSQGAPEGGVELVILETEDCQGFTEVACAQVLDLAGQGGVQANVTIGNTYFLMVDGTNSDACDFVMDANGIADLSDPPEEPEFDPPLPAEVCEGENFTVSISNMSDCGVYAFINNSPGNIQIDADFPNDPDGTAEITALREGTAEFCIEAANICARETYCYEVTILPIPVLDPVPDMTVCDPLIDFCDYESFFDPPLNPDPFGEGWDYSVHDSRFAAEDGSNPLGCPFDLTGSYRSTFYIRTVQNGICSSVTPFNVVFAKPRFPDIEVFPQCGPTEIDLSQEIQLTDQFATQYENIKFYETEVDALDDVGALNPPVVDQSGTYWVRVESDTDPTCVTVESFEVTIVPTPEIEVEEPPLICDVDTFRFDLSSLEVISLTPDYAAGDLDIRYYNDPPDITQLDVSINPPIVTQPGTYYAVAVVELNSPLQRYCASEPVPIVLDTVPPPRVEISAVPPNCPEGETEIIFDVRGAGDYETEYVLSNGDLYATTLVPGTQSEFINVENFIDTISVRVTLFEPIGTSLCEPEIGDSILVPPPITPTLDLLQSDTICRGDSIDLVFDFVGNGNFDVDFTDGTNEFELEDVSNGDEFRVGPQNTTIYRLQEGETEDGCEIQLGDSIEIVVNGIPDFEITGYECQGTQTYTVTIELSGSSSGNYLMDGNPVNGSTFVSDPIPSGQAFEFELNDDNGCGPITIQGTHNCACDNSPGTMQTQLLELCVGDLGIGTHNGDNTNLPGDNFFFVLHDEAGAMLGNLLGTNTVPEFSFDPGTMMTGVRYYISAVSGVDDGMGGIDFSDVCSQVSVGQPVVWNELPDVQLTSPGVLCGDEDAVFDLTFTSGTAPFVVEYSLNGVPQANATVGGQTGTITVAANNLTPGTNTLEITGITDANDCFADPMVQADVEVLEDIEVSFTTECDNTNTSYDIILTISGGSGTYFVDSDPVSGNSYTAGPYPSGSGPTTFTVTDDAGCETEITIPARDCDCETNPGSLSGNSITACEGEDITLNIATPSTLDGDDIEGLWIFGNAGDPIGSLIGFQAGTTIAYNAGNFNTAQTYYVALAAGNDDGSGVVDLQGDPCAGIGNIVEIEWTALPDVQLTGPGVLCGDEDAIFDLTFTSGTAPFVVEYSLNGAPQANATVGGQTGTITVAANNLTPGTNTLEITGITDANDCFADPNATADVEVLDDIEVSFTTECDNTNTSYDIILTISGGSGTYFVDSDPVSGNSYTAGPYPSGSGPTTFTVTDDAGCETEITIPARDCDCETNPGSLSGNSFTACEGEAITVNIATPSTLDGDDIEGILIFGDTGDPIGSLIGFQAGTTIAYNAGNFNTGQTYYVALAAGNDDGSGVVDLQGDPCAGLGNIVEIEWTALPDVQLTGPGVLCGDEDAIFDLTFTSGTAPFVVEYSLNGAPQANATVGGQTGTITVAANNLTPGTNTLEITGITDANDCFADPMVQADVEVLEDIEVGFSTECDNTNTSYDIILTISGGSGTYFVDSDPVSGNSYTAGPYPSGSGPTTFTVTDDAGCETEITIPARDCDCETNPGSLSGNSFTACEGEAITVNIATPSTLDGDDIEGILIFGDTGDPIGSLIGFQAGTTIAYNAGNFNTGQTYYVALAAGNDDGSGVVDLQGDPCAGLGNIVEIEWTALPDVQLTGPGVLCGDEDAIFDLTFTSGTAPFVVEYSLNGAPQANATVGGQTGTITVAANNLTPGTNTLEITGITDANDCFADPMVQADVEVLEDIAVSFSTECDNTNTSYDIILTISGGSGTYFVDGDPVTGNTYRSGPNPSGSGPFTFTVTDDAGCSTEITTIPRDCDCETAAGSLAGGALIACEGEAITVNIATPSTLDGDDIEGLWIFGDAGDPIGSLINFQTGTTIAYNAGNFNPGQTYYVALAVGNNDGSGVVDLQGDACATLSNVVEISWAERPVAMIDGPSELVLGCGQADDLILRTTGSSPVTAEYQWILQQGATTSDPLTGPTLTVGSPGVYILELRTAGGSCVDRDTVTVTADQDLPTVVLTQDGPLTCIQESVVLDGSASDFGPNFEAEWELPDGSVLTGQGLTLTVNEVGTYLLRITDLDSECSNSAQVTVDANRQEPVVDAGQGGQFTCGTDRIELNASATGTSGDISVTWYLDGVAIPGATSLNLEATSPGTYRVVVTDNATGCEGEDVVTLTADIGTISSAVVETMPPTCPGERDGSIEVSNVTGGTPPYQYSLNGAPFTTQPQFQLLRAGVYEVEIRDVNDCRYSQTVELEDGTTLLVTMGADTVIDIGDELILQPIISVANPQDVIAIDTIYISFVDSLSCTRCATPFAIIEPSVPANYVVTVVTESGCVVTDSRFVGVNLEKPPFFIPSAFSPNGDGFNDRVELSFREPELVESVSEFVIYNRWGNLMYREASVIPGKRIQLWDGNFNGKPMLPQVFVYSFQVKYKDGTEEVFKGDITLFR